MSKFTLIDDWLKHLIASAGLSDWAMSNDVGGIPHAVMTFDPDSGIHTQLPETCRSSPPL
jgi:hypothetical protein